MAEVHSTFLWQTGGRVPSFELPDASGQMVSIDEVMGSRGLLVVFACNHCPYVVHLARALGDWAREMRPLGIHTVAINANDIERYPEDGPAWMTSFAADHQWQFPYLIDASQEIAIAYGAACTPDFFLIDHQQVLCYTGQFDDTRPRTGVAAHGTDLRAAAQAMLAGEAITRAPKPSSGCHIKWLPGNEPSWWINRQKC